MNIVERDAICKELALQLYFGVEDPSLPISQSTIDYTIKKHLGYPTSMKIPYFASFKVAQIREGFTSLKLLDEQPDSTGTILYVFNRAAIRAIDDAKVSHEGEGNAEPAQHNTESPKA